MKSLNDLKELIFEVENDLFIPKRFRKEPFTTFIRNKYVVYLKRELARLEGKNGK